MLPDDDPLRPLLRYLLSLGEDRSGDQRQTCRRSSGCCSPTTGPGRWAAFELLRLARAATLLTRSNLSVAAVAEDCGFANPYHFSRRFHRTYGQPPGRYRRAATRLEPTEPLAPREGRVSP